MGNWSKAKLLKMRRNSHLASVSLSDEVAVETPEIFEGWVVSKYYEAGERFQFEGELYKVLQNHTSQENWLPNNTPSLYTKIHKPGDGSHDNPIVYDGNMELFEGLYYTQADVLYYCFRSSEIPVYNPLSELVGLYVEITD